MTQYNPFPYCEPDDESRILNDAYAPPRYEMEDESAPPELVCHCPSCSSSLSVDASTTPATKVQCMVCGTVFAPLGNDTMSPETAPPPYYEASAPSYPAPPQPSYPEPPYNVPNPYSQPAPPPAHPSGYAADPYYPPNPPVYQPPVNPAYGPQNAYYRTSSSGYQSAFQEPEYHAPVSSPPPYTVQNYDSGYNSPPPAYGYDPYENQPVPGFERHNPLTAPPAPPMQPPMPYQPQPAPAITSPPLSHYAPPQSSAPPIPAPAQTNPPMIQQLPVRPPPSTSTPVPPPEPETPADPSPVSKAKTEETGQIPEKKPSPPPPSPEEQAKQAEKEALTGTDAPSASLEGELENGSATQPFKLIKSEFDYYMREEEPPVRKQGAFFKIVFFMFLPLVGIGWSLWQLFGEGNTNYLLHGGLSLFCFIVFFIALSACNRSCPQCGRWSALSKEKKADQYGSYTIRHCGHCDYMLESER